MDDPKKPLVTCGGTAEFEGVKYLLSAAMIEGTDLDTRRPQIPQSQVNYVVTLDFNGDGTKAFAEISAGAGQHREAVRDRAGRPGPVRADHGRR